MIRNPILDLYTGALLALGGPMALLLPHRLFLAMLMAGGEARRVGRADDAD